MLAGNEFYTDANSLEMVKRVTGQRPGFVKQEPEEFTANPIGGNYYPITSSIAIADKTTKQQLALITERGQGAESFSCACLIPAQGNVQSDDGNL